MSMKKKLKVGGIILLAVLVVVIFYLCYRAGIHMAAMEQEGQETEEEAVVTPTPTPVPTTAPTPTPILVMQQQPTVTPAQEGNKKYTFQGFQDNLAQYFDKGQIKEIKKGISSYLRGSRTHAEVSTVTCTEYHMRSQTRNQIYGYVELDDGNLLQYTYDFDRKEVKVMETAVTIQNLQDKKKQEEAAEQARIQQEEENKKKEQLAQEIFNRGEGGTSATPAPIRQGGYVQQGNGGTVTYTYPSAGDTGSTDWEEEIRNEQIPDDEGIPDEEAPDADEIFEEQIPEDIFSD